jgi:mono/diheme cytochrome c family protein
MAEAPPKAFAVLGLFDRPDDLLAAIPGLRDRKLGRLEAYTPYPVHGLDQALGLRASPLGAMVLVMGIVGALAALGCQYWISAVDYPIVTGGKAPGSWEALVPIMFEISVLFAAFTAALGMLILLNRQPYFGHPVLKSTALRAITRDRFALALEADPELDVTAARAALAAAGAKDIEALPAAGPQARVTSRGLLRLLGSAAAACLLAGIGTRGAVRLMPVLPPVYHMLDQPRLNPQQGTSFFRDGRAMRMPVPGTVARGYLPLGVGSQEEAAALVNPLPRTRAVLERGKAAFIQRCAVCHGPLGTGSGSLTPAYGGTPANLQAEQFRNAPDGKIFWVISKGKKAMPAHEADLTPDQRWAVVHYVRALQRAQNAKDADLDLGRGTP